MLWEWLDRHGSLKSSTRRTSTYVCCWEGRAFLTPLPSLSRSPHALQCCNHHPNCYIVKNAARCRRMRDPSCKYRLCLRSFSLYPMHVQQGQEPNAKPALDFLSIEKRTRAKAHKFAQLVLLFSGILDQVPLSGILKNACARDLEVVPPPRSHCGGL
jgi:hypothetical protein